MILILVKNKNMRNIFYRTLFLDVPNKYVNPKLQLIETFLSFTLKKNTVL